MTTVRILVGTQKGAFVLTSDGDRTDWTITGPHFGGWEIYHVIGSPADPDRVYASQSTGWFGQVIQRSDDGGHTWHPMGNEFAYEGSPGTHQWYDGTPHPWAFARVWHLEPSLTDPDTVFAGVEDAALFRSTDGAASWAELPGLRTQRSGPAWQPGAGGLAVHTILVDPTDPDRIHVAISAAGVFRSDDGGGTWHPANRGLRSQGIPDPDAEVGHASIASRGIGPTPTSSTCRSTGTSCAAMTAGTTGTRSAATCRPISGSRSPSTPMSRTRSTSCRSPATPNTIRPRGELRVFRSRSGGDEWEPLTRGLPQRDCYVNVLRESMSVDDLDPCGIYFGTTGGQVYASSDEGDTWDAIVRDLPRVMSVEVQSLP